jgi:hypothetical protein
MAFIERFRNIGKFLTGKHDAEVRAEAAEHTMRQVAGKLAHSMEAAESSNIIAYMMEEFGWNKVTDNSLLRPMKRTVNTIRNGIIRNQLKYSTDGYIKRGINLHTDFVFGKGIDIPKAKSEIIMEEVVKPFWRDPVNRRNYFSFMAQQRRHRETSLSGELNILLKIDPITSRVRLYPILPHEIIEVIPDKDEPGRPAFYQLRHTVREWDFQRNQWKGTVDMDLQIHRSYRYKIFEASNDELSRGLVYHVGLNEFFDLMRGESDIHACYEESESARDIAQDGATLSRANAEIGYKMIIKKGGKTVKDDVMEYLKTRTDGANPTPAPGSEWVENDAVSREWMQSRDTGAQSREKDQRMMRMYGFAAMGFGEHYFGDASTGNLATSTSMELPVIKMIEGEQKFWESVYHDLVNFQIDIAAVGGIISGEVVDREELEVETEENRLIDIDFPPITQKEIDRYVTAITGAESAALLPYKEAARLVMEAFGVNNIDEALDELTDAKTIQDKIAEVKSRMATQQPTPVPGAGPGAPPVNVKKQGEKPGDPNPDTYVPGDNPPPFEPYKGSMAAATESARGGNGHRKRYNTVPSWRR